MNLVIKMVDEGDLNMFDHVADADCSDRTGNIGGLYQEGYVREDGKVQRRVGTSLWFESCVFTGRQR